MKKILSLILVGILTLGLFAGCTNNEQTSEEPAPTNEEAPKEEGKLEGTVEVVGSTSVTPVAQSMAEAFMSKNPGVKVNVQGVGSTAGVKAAHDGTADIGMASRNLKEAEKEWGLDEHVIAYDGIAVVVHPSNGITGLSKEDVTKIFKKEVTNWKELGGKDKEIIVVSRESGSGTRGAFEGIMDLQEKVDGKKVSAVQADITQNGNGGVKAAIASKENAIGYVSLSYLDESIKSLEIDGAEATVENIKADEYKVSRPFLMLTKGEVSEATQAYLDFIFSEEGQEIVGEKLIRVK